MLPIADLLSRFKNLTNTEGVKKKLITEEIQNIVGFVVDKSAISFSKNTVFITVNPLYKTEILLKKDEILKKIQKIPGLEYINNLH